MRPMTNGDKFRQMTDEDIARYFCAYGTDEHVRKYCNTQYCDPEKCDPYDPDTSQCNAACVRWLQSPAEVPNGK